MQQEHSFGDQYAKSLMEQSAHQTMAWRSESRQQRAHLAPEGQGRKGCITREEDARFCWRVQGRLGPVAFASQLRGYQQPEGISSASLHHCR